MTPIPLVPSAALSALRDHIARPVNGPFAPPDWLRLPVRPLSAWQAEGAQSADRKAPRPVATLYQFAFAQPVQVGVFSLAGYVLVVLDGGSWLVNWWHGADPETTATFAAWGAVGYRN
jgi:hypothetical protein